MAYLTDMSDAAERHYRDGCKLLVENRIDNAGSVNCRTLA